MARITHTECLTVLVYSCSIGIDAYTLKKVADFSKEIKAPIISTSLLQWVNLIFLNWVSLSLDEPHTG
jgi:hypothetical protein